MGTEGHGVLIPIMKVLVSILVELSSKALHSRLTFGTKTATHLIPLTIHDNSSGFFEEILATVTRKVSLNTYLLTYGAEPFLRN
jgi:hypothetical protein